MFGRIALIDSKLRAAPSGRFNQAFYASSQSISDKAAGLRAQLVKGSWPKAPFSLKIDSFALSRRLTARCPSRRAFLFLHT